MLPESMGNSKENLQLIYTKQTKQDKIKKWFFSEISLILRQCNSKVKPHISSFVYHCFFSLTPQWIPLNFLAMRDVRRPRFRLYFYFCNVFQEWDSKRTYILLGNLN
ncbi:hypothetical protein KIN20_015746 [Parelaphostrongylus tenuis]|uniref:Uncharacterized protein n=1 Tax=Parelaphostrongylus tenuis TaxID=148309 RepID=A0AAD5MK31_PARTN|nr:hypothetical protein KIN20_000041 [Parelaphostrongylus tenuis]KAJ1357571.1 hypothetical protein KIN20_015746 [Parelaphostrongylus tenuis]